MRPPLLIRRIEGHSMMPDLPPGKIVIASGWLPIGVGDVVIARAEGKDIIKRVRAISVDKLELAGDNASDSTDYGSIKKSQVMGRLIWPRL